MNAEQAAALRAPFPPEAIGKLPRVTCKKCSDRNQECDKHKKHQCAECGNWISTQHIHLDYVGHAAVTDRLLEVDPEWTWHPGAADPNTLGPLCTDGGLWIRMTVCGVTRWGWGDGPDIKQRISDAIRNAAMRFGVGLDLWSKEDLGHDTENAESGRLEQNPQGVTRSSQPSVAAQSPPDSATSKNRRQALKASASALEAAGFNVRVAVEKWQLPKIDDCDETQLNLYDEMLHDLEHGLDAVAAT